MNKINTELYLITGAAGFIGYYLSLQLLKNGIQVIGIDNKNNYYNIHLKQARLKELKQYDNFIFLEEDISDKQKVMDLFAEYILNIIVYLADHLGVHY